MNESLSFRLFRRRVLSQKRKERFQIDFKRKERREGGTMCGSEEKGVSLSAEAPGAAAESLERICHINKGGGIGPF